MKIITNNKYVDKYKTIYFNCLNFYKIHINV